MSYEKEVEMVKVAREMDMLTCPYIFNVEEGERMTRAGADVVVVHLGLTTGGSIGADKGKGDGNAALDNCVRTVQEIGDRCVQIRPELIVLFHGGPVEGMHIFPPLSAPLLSPHSPLLDCFVLYTHPHYWENGS